MNSSESVVPSLKAHKDRTNLCYESYVTLDNRRRNVLQKLVGLNEPEHCALSFLENFNPFAPEIKLASVGCIASI